MVKKISETERKTYEYIKQCIEELGYPPSVREICAHCNFKSTSTAHRAINSLTEKGYLRKKDNLNRAIGLAGSAGIKVPLVGTVTAGVPITAIEHISEYIDFNPARSYDGELFALKVRGDSMINAGIDDGDTLIISRQTEAKDGEIVIATLNGASTLKTYMHHKDGRPYLHPENSSYEDIEIHEGDAFFIQGVLIYVLKNYRGYRSELVYKECVK